MISNDRFRSAMAAFPSGVTIVTTTDGQGVWAGFTASSFCSLSVDPPLVLVCLATDAACHAAFSQADRWNIHFVDGTTTDTALRFARRGAEKFRDGEFVADAHGIPRLADAMTILSCRYQARFDGGDHTILVGLVDDVTLREGRPVYYHNRSFHEVA